MRLYSTPTLVFLVCGTTLVRSAVNIDGSHATEPASEDNLDDPSPIDDTNAYHPDNHDCPPPCVDYTNTHSWIPYLSVERLGRCKAPMLLQFSISQPLDDADSTTLIRSCTIGSHPTAARIANEKSIDNPKKDDSLVDGGILNVAPACIIPGSPVDTKLSVGKGDSGNGDGRDIASLLEGMAKFFGANDNCNEKFLFGYYKQTVASIYIGPGLGKSTVKSGLKEFGEYIGIDASAANQTVAELCGNGRKPEQVFGVAIDTTGNLAAGNVQATGEFLGVQVFDLAGEDAEFLDGHMTPSSTPLSTSTPSPAHSGSSARFLRSLKHDQLFKRAVCKYMRVEDGDSCTTLSTRCGIRGADFLKYNTKSNLCATLKGGDYVCCSAGDPYKPPAPEPNADGTCKTHLIENGDSCDSLAKKFGVTVKDIEKWNAKKTWAWTECKDMLIGYNMCVGPGLPPMPPPQNGAEYGPLVPGTKPPKDNSTSLADLNPCPLKACCSNWGFCGVFPDHCTMNAPKDGGPGTKKPGFKDTCVSNCNREIKENSGPPEEFGRIGYYEAFGMERECLQLEAKDANTDGSYTHIHWAFASIDPKTWKPVIVQGKDQWADFKKLKEKRIVSLGGWADSTEPDKYNIIRSAIIQNRETFASNLAQCVKDEGIDGIDIDWEYPGAPDIMVDGKPIGQKTDGLNYLRFLTVLKDKMPSGKTVSIAAPASYWYLKQFPIDQITKVIDYVVFMTYDLHGQWDYGNPNAFDECPSGKCIRSHVNMTETKVSLSMITKAGVPSNKIFVGESSYGRSFRMAKDGSSGAMCEFTGSRTKSDAKPGRCTKEGGYLANAEITEILNGHGKFKNFYDEDSQSNVLLYGGDYVSYMTPETKKSRRAVWRNLNFAGSIDWAVDLQDFLEYVTPTYGSSCDSVYTTLDQLQGAIYRAPPYCVDKYIVDVEIAIMERSLKKYKELVDSGYDDKFKIYERYVGDQVPDQIDAFMASGKADDYFHCTETKDVTCCNSCTYIFCREDCDDSKDCKPAVRAVNIKCPTTLENGSEGLSISEKIPNATYSLVDSKGFWHDLAKEYGIDKSWVKFGDKHVRTNNGCQYAGEDIEECIKKNDNWWYNYPLKGNFQVPNPKKLIGESYDESKDLLSRLKIMRDNAEYDEFMQWPDLLDAGSLPALTMEAAVASMDTVIETAKEIKKAEREEMILGFVTGFLFFIPVVGEGIAAGMSSLRSILLLTGVAGEAGLMVYSIVEDSSSAFMAVFGFLASAGVGRSGFEKAAKSRRSMPSSEVQKLGPVKTDLDRIENFRGGSCKLDY
ncbi:Chitinase [Fusarium sp. LHS14.1]|nr:Chitinase [Fusarium sp. LHS14.1]